MSDAKKGTFGDWITDRIMRGAIAASAILPYGLRVRSFGALIERIIAPLAGFRRRAERNLALIYPDMPAPERRRLARAVCNNVGRTFIENYARKGFARQIEQSAVRGAGLDPLAQAQADGRPVLFVTGHFGNHEAPRMALTQRGYRIGGLYRPMSNPYFNAHYEQTMLDMSGDVFPQGRRGTAGFVRMLRDGGMGTLLFDVRATAFAQMPFLGRPAHTATSAAEIALRLDALVIPYFATREPDGLNFEIEIEAPIPLTDVETMMRAMTDRLEAHIRAHPEQWFWVHNRWG